MKENWTRDLERILWEQAVYNRGEQKNVFRYQTVMFNELLLQNYSYKSYSFCIDTVNMNGGYDSPV